MRGGGPFLLQFLAAAALAAALVAPTGLAFVVGPTAAPQRRPLPFSSQQLGLRRPLSPCWPLWCELCGDGGHDDRSTSSTSSNSLFTPATDEDNDGEGSSPVPPDSVPAGAGEGKDAAAGAMINFIKGYKQLISPLLPPACRFLPTCSEYAVEAIEKFGPSKGAVLTAWRILRCNPFGGRGYDPPVWPPPPWDAGSTSSSRR